MTGPTPDRSAPLSEAEVSNVLLSLRRKEGHWRLWGDRCQQLQKAGFTPQRIFEETGFEPIHQNQLVVAAQVYSSMVGAGLSDAVQARFEKTGSDTLYELRILNQSDRVAAATLVTEKGIDSEGARDVAKALKDFSRFANSPEEFPQYPEDAVAYYYWKLAKQQRDLQERSRLIAQGLRFAASASARQQIEKLLTDFSVAAVKKVPLLPTYRLETESEVPRLLPVAGKLPMTLADLKAVPMVEAEEPFNIVKFSGEGAWVPMPGWQIVYAAEDPVVLIASSHDLPNFPDEVVEDVLVLVDRGDRQWNEFSYFLINHEDQLQVEWLAEAGNAQIIGRVALVLRSKKVLDEGYNKEPWQLDE
ncbi:RuBisCO accumulation factor 1 [Leptolyngbya sp. AN02str]|uniref:RuBisCO accumulation factor 1 n=1 Tax=Leptolyngbya sp. AN02str TaxID=3423363 RepID=UPI003D317E16